MKLSGSNQSVEKTLLIIETLASAHSPMRLSELAKAVDMPPSTVLRMVNTLVNLGYARQEDEPSKRYALTTRFLRIGQQAAEHIDIREISHPLLLELSQKTGQSSCLSICDQNKVRYLDVVEGSGSMVAIRQRIGGSARMHCTGSGKLFLMQYTDEQLDEFISQRGLPPLTPNTVTNKAELCHELKTCLRRGYAMDDEECEIGVRCAAAPVYDYAGRVIAAISISGIISHMQKLRVEMEMVPLLLEAAEKVTGILVGKREDEGVRSEPKQEQSAI